MTDIDITALRLQLALTNIDLQLYKGSIYRLRWGTPGGIDQALPCYDEVTRVLGEVDWPSNLQRLVDELATHVAAYRQTLVVKDVTSASAQNTRMVRAFEALREHVRVWPGQPTSGSAGPSPERELTAAHTGMEAPSA